MRLGWLVAEFKAHCRLTGGKTVKTLPEPTARVRVAA
jgi:hypothetical protein